MTTMKLQPNYYNYMLHGTKRIEIRVYDEKRKTLNLGDTITFFKEPDLKESFQAKIIGLLRYENFDELFQDFDISILADKSITKETLKKELEQFYPTEKQEKYGVLGIRVELERKEYVSKK